MGNMLSTMAKKMSKSHKRRRAWSNIVRTLAMVIIFCTTYALILPAITMRSDPICGMQAHIHGDECYEVIQVDTLTCTLPEGEGHTHTDACCPIPEGEGHTHSDACCTASEEETHSHGEACCDIPEAPAHHHSDACCDIPESEGHTHDETCWTHTEQIGTKLICNLPEHTHTDSCYPLETEPTGDEGYHCGYAQHIHRDTCEAGCTIVEHIHEADCILDRVDMTADVETADDWEKMARELDHTGHWAQDLLTMAESQRGYRESELNVVLSAETLYGYTRYGDWYGNPYQDWGNLFLAFCLNYADISEADIPRHSDTERWQAALDEKGLLQDPDENQLKPGSIIFWKDDGGEINTAVIQQVEKESGNAAKTTYRVIAGDVDGQVDYRTVKMKSITAVCDLEKAQLQSQGIEIDPTEPEATEPEVTEPEETEPEATEPEETEVTEAEETVYTAHTEHYLVTVTCPAGLELPEKAALRVTEYDRSSETYIRRCQEVGYELEWLLNIGFYAQEEELELNGKFQVEVTSKQGISMGEDITHFADTGTEQLEGDVKDESVRFVSEGFSDFGGGNATRAVSNVYQFTTVDVASNQNSPYLQTGVNYVAYVIQNNQIIFLSSSGSNLIPIFVQNMNGTTTSNATWSVSASQLPGNASNFTWQLVNENGNYYLTTQNGSKRLGLYNGWCRLDGGTPIIFEDKGTGAEIGSRNANNYGQIYELRYADAGNGDYKWRASWYNDSGQLSTPTETVYFAQINTGEVVLPPDVDYPNYPHAVHTGEISVNRLRFYNLCENGEKGVSGLADCVFEITGPNGYTETVISTDRSYVELPKNMPDGTYTITEVSLPDGYVRDVNHTREFKIVGGNLASDGTIGTFINHSLEQITNSKTAEVEDYENRIYQITMTAKSNMRRYELEPIDVLFVVDQSNSMLFPAELDDTGLEVTLNLNGSGNASAMNDLDLDPNQVYYIIADPEGSSTVWAVWYDGQGWMCQDASYYAKAKHNNEVGYQDDNEQVIFPTYGRSYGEQSSYESSLNSKPKTRSNGGSLDKDLTGSTLGTYISNAPNGANSRRFTLYTTDNVFNRLHYLEQSLANIIYQLADANGKNRVSLTEFTKVLGECEGPHELSSHADEMVEMVTNIKTSGGTRQDIALEHIYEEHLSDDGDHFNKGVDHTYTLLITDGAPVGTKDEPVGSSDDSATTNAFGATDWLGNKLDVSIYGRIKGWAEKVREKSTLMTVGLGMGNVKGGKEVLEEIASNKDFYCAIDDASQLESFVQKLLFESFRAKERITVQGDLVDEISDSFYPIAWVRQGTAGQHRLVSADGDRDWVLLNPGDWITLDGRLTAAGASDAAGQLLQRDNGVYYVQWNDQTISGSSGWEGVFYVKAKEDFLGGNGIDTNGSDATLSVTLNDQNVVRAMPTPTVNVRLLDLNEHHSEVTVYLGDWVNGAGSTPIDSLRGFFDDTVFTKLISDGGKPLNRVSVGSDGSDGLEDAVFHLRYAMGRDLTEEEWELLQNGNRVIVPYLYDDASSHGDVGYFTFSLEKTGLTYAGHEASTACQPGGTPASDACEHPAETYTLKVVYTAYRLDEAGRPKENVHNAARGPGYEVGTGAALTNGLGVLEKNNVHEVHVISGKIEIWKYFDENVLDPQERTFTFNLNRVVDGEVTVVDTKTITIPAGAAQGREKITFDNLPRGTYTVTEVEDADYVLKQITVLESTNCESEPERNASGPALVFVMGNNPRKENVIGFRQAGDRYTGYVDPVNGVYGAAAFTNGIRIIEAELPVEKCWVDSADAYDGVEVYVALYQNGNPVCTSDGYLRILELNAENGWKGSFLVALSEENASPADSNYSIRELSRVAATPHEGWASGVLEGSDNTVVYYEKALEAGDLFHTTGKAYFVTYGAGADGQLTVTNSRMFELPNTGAAGTKLYTISGLLLILAAALMLGFRRRRIRKGGQAV